MYITSCFSWTLLSEDVTVNFIGSSLWEEEQASGQERETRFQVSSFGPNESSLHSFTENIRKCKLVCPEGCLWWKVRWEKSEEWIWCPSLQKGLFYSPLGLSVVFFIRWLRLTQSHKAGKEHPPDTGDVVQQVPVFGLLRETGTLLNTREESLVDRNIILSKNTYHVPLFTTSFILLIHLSD